MSFVSRFILNQSTSQKRSLQSLPGMIRRRTQAAITSSTLSVNQLTQGTNWYQPNPLHVLETIDAISNECSAVADSATILYRSFSQFAEDKDQKLQSAVIDSNTQIVDFLNSNHLNMNDKLLTLLHHI